MGHFAKFSGLAAAVTLCASALGVLCALTAPASAGGHSVGGMGHFYRGGGHYAAPVGRRMVAAPPVVRGAAPAGAGYGYRHDGAYAGGPRPGYPVNDYFSGGVGQAFPAGGYYRGGVWQPGFRPARDYGYAGGGYYGGGYAVTPYPDYPPAPYPIGYQGASYEPTGYGVSYNVPRTPYLPPRIIYLNGYHRHHAYPRAHGVTIVRGNSVQVAY